ESVALALPGPRGRAQAPKQGRILRCQSLDQLHRCGITSRGQDGRPCRQHLPSKLCRPIRAHHALLLEMNAAAQHRGIWQVRLTNFIERGREARQRRADYLKSLDLETTADGVASAVIAVHVHPRMIGRLERPSLGVVVDLLRERLSELRAIEND